MWFPFSQSGQAGSLSYPRLLQRQTQLHCSGLKRPAQRRLPLTRVQSVTQVHPDTAPRIAGLRPGTNRQLQERAGSENGAPTVPAVSGAVSCMHSHHPTGKFASCAPPGDSLMFAS